MQKIIVETCAGSVEECLISYEGGASRIELNNGVYMGGLTPSYACVKLAKEKMPLPIMSMLRPRGGGFHYNSVEIETIFTDAEALISAGTDGLVFGFLHADGTVDEITTQKMVELCHEHNIEAVFHRAFDVTPDPDAAMMALIRCGVDRVLTSGQEDKAYQALDLIARLQADYGDRIEIVLGSGINSDNIETLVKSTKVRQYHASFKAWYDDPTTSRGTVSYRYDAAGDYDGVNLDVLQDFVEKSQSL